MGDELPEAEAPEVAGKALEITAEVESAGTSGVIVMQGGAAQGYAIYLKDGKLSFAVRESRELTTISAKEALGNGHFQVQAALHQDGAMTLAVDGKQVAEGKVAGPIPQQPRAGLFIGKAGGKAGGNAVGEFDPPDPFSGKVTNVRVQAAAAK
jgi:hypothetical protein